MALGWAFWFGGWFGSGVGSGVGGGVGGGSTKGGLTAASTVWLDVQLEVWLTTVAAIEAVVVVVSSVWLAEDGWPKTIHGSRWRTESMARFSARFSFCFHVSSSPAPLTNETR
jgi:hypothetical protein